MISNRYLYNPAGLIKAVFPKFYWRTTNNKILLTFDDGPISENTDLILDELDRNKIKALFFCVGENIYRNPEIGKEILDRGHSIGNHTYNHKRITKLGKDEFNNQVDLTSKIIKEELGYSTLYFRPPHGRFNLSLSKKLSEKNLKNVMWSLLTYDYQNRLDIVKFAITNYLRKDSIIVLHDSHKSKDIIVDSIRFIADEVQKRGFEFGEAKECLK